MVLWAAACTQGQTDATEHPTATQPGQEANNTAVPASPNTITQPVVTEPNNPTAPPSDTNTVVLPSLRVVGRTLPDDGNGPILNWPNSQIWAGFSGTSLKVTLKELTQHTYTGLGRVNNHFSVSIDDGPPTHLPVLQDGTQTLTLATNLAPGAHHVVLTKRTEGQIGSTQFLGFTLSANATLLPAPAVKQRRIEFIGDSGTVGYGADGNDNANTGVCAFTPDTENAAMSYSALTGKALGADVHITGNSGKGIYQNRDPIGDNVNTLPVMFTWACADTQLDFGTWDANAWQPQAVVVIVGGNDFAASIPTPSAYAAKANAFVKTLRAAYPNAWLFVTISPLLSNAPAAKQSVSTETVGRQYAQAMVTAAQDAKVAYIDIPVDDGSRNYGCDYHLSPASNIYFANLFAKAIGQKLGWTPTPL
jgi:lysophospholipase L1-like esterase